MTPWLRHRGLRPIATSHPGQGKEVEPVSSSGTPDDVQFFALSLIISPQEQMAHALSFFMVAC